MARLSRRRSHAPERSVACLFSGGPLDGQTLPVGEFVGAHYHLTTDGGAVDVHIYHRRSHPSAYWPLDDPRRRSRGVTGSPHLFDHVPAMTRRLWSAADGVSLPGSTDG